jgi:hypothetical protein
MGGKKATALAMFEGMDLPGSSTPAYHIQLVNRDGSVEEFA